MRASISRHNCLAACLLILLGLVPVAQAAAGLCDEEITAWAVQDTIYVLHQEAFYNCCVLMVSEIELPEPWVVDFIEIETYPISPCYCMCFMDITMWGGGFGPGTYTIRVWNEDRTILFGETQVEVIENLGGVPGYVACIQSECYGTSSVETDDETQLESTWGRIKEHYR